MVSAIAGLGAFLIAQGFLGALPHEYLASWAALSLTVLAIGATAAAMIALAGPAGLGLSAALMIFIGNPFSGATAAPRLLPAAVGHIGQWLPPGAAVSLLRSTAYFGGHGASGHLIVLLLWSVLGLAAIVAGHHAPIRFAARRVQDRTRDLAQDRTRDLAQDLAQDRTRDLAQDRTRYLASAPATGVDGSLASVRTRLRPRRD